MWIGAAIVDVEALCTVSRRAALDGAPLAEYACDATAWRSEEANAGFGEAAAAAAAA